MDRQIPVTKPFFSEAEAEAVAKTLASGWVAQGPKVAEFERAVALHEGVREGVATTSCTSALHLAMTAGGLQSGMDAIAPAFTFVATENAIVMTGATPVMTDIRRDTFNMDVDALEALLCEAYREEGGNLVNRKSGNVLWGIVPVHEFGLCCEIDRINALALKYGLRIVEDAACALGARIGSRHEGAFGNISCVSFHPRKSITTGEGGMVLTDDSALAERMRALRSHGCTVSADARDKQGGFLLPDYPEAGYNYRMTDIQAAVGLAQMEKLDRIIVMKRELAARYNNLLPERVPELIPPTEPEGYFHTYQSYVCMLDLKEIGIADTKDGGAFRNEVLRRLEERGIATRQGTHAVHMLGYYSGRFGYRPEDYPNAYACDHLSVTLPLYAGMTEEEQDEVIRSFRIVLDGMRRK